MAVHEITHELSFDENQTDKWYSGYEILDISPERGSVGSDVYSIKQLAVSVTISGLEQLQNSGQEQMIDLLEARIEVAMATMKNTISAGLYSDGTCGKRQADHGPSGPGLDQPDNWNGGRYPASRLGILAESSRNGGDQRHPDRRQAGIALRRDAES